jgi:uncharacterized sulfatase
MRHGFDDYFGIPYSNDMSKATQPRAEWASRTPPTPLIRGETTVEHEPDQSTLTQRYTEVATEFIRKSSRAGGPFFLYMPHTFPHWPLAASSRFRGKSLAGLYGDVVEELDWSVGEVLRVLREQKIDRNTLVILTSDNGMPFPRAKCNLYDYGTRMPLAICWPGRTRGGRVIDDFIGFTDLAPTILETAGLKPPPAMTGRSFLDLLTSSHTAAQAPRRDRVCMGRERHSVARAGGAGYPMRAIRTRDFLYIHNLAPDRWPAGDGPGYFDIDPSPTKHFIIRNRLGECRGFFRMAFKKRPAEELYDLAKDPDQLSNLAGRSEYSGVQENLRSELHRQLILTGDPRAQGREALWDSYPLRVPKRA